MGEIIVDKSIIDEDGFYDICLKLISDDAIVKCNMYIYEDEVKKLKDNIRLMYEFKSKNYIFKYDAIGLCDNITLDFNVEENGHVLIKYNITNDENIFKSCILTDLESMNNFIKDIK